MMLNIKKKFKQISLKKFLAAILLIFTVFCLVSLSSFNPADPSWFYFNSENRAITNKLGFLGSNLASVLLFLFGPSIIIFLIFMIYLTSFLFNELKLRNEYERFIAFILLFFSSAVLFHDHKISLFNYTGIVYPVFFKKYLNVFDKQIVLIWVYCFLFVSLILISRFNFISLYSFLKFKKIKSVSVKINYLFKMIIAPFIMVHNFIFSLISTNDEVDDALFYEEYGYLLEESETNIINDHFWENFSPATKIDVAPKIEIDQHQKTEDQITKIPMPDIKTIFSNTDNNYDNKKLIKESELQSKTLEEKLKCFGIFGSVVSIKYGPVITLFEYEPHIDSKISKIIALEDDLAMALQTTSLRIIAPIPGKSVVGFEIANKNRKNVLISQIINSTVYQDFNGYLPLIFGEDVIGNKVVVDLVKMPHLLIAGSTGSGKSIALNAMIVSLLCKTTPSQLRLILIDPKRLEFTPYNDIAHLLFPIITLPQYAIAALKWLIKEMEMRYEMMSKTISRNIFDYNNYCKKNNLKELPFIVVIIDELADLMMTAGKDIEDSIIRIAQMARACGIHMIVATQRPSVDVITGLIKVNFPSRISFKVASKIDSRTILDSNGADKLLGKGDMLFLNSQMAHLQRLHGAYVTDEEVVKVVNHIQQYFKTDYLNLIDISNNFKQDFADADDFLYKDILGFLKEVDEVSISLLQRRFKIGYNRSARIIEMLELQGHILPSEGGRPRKVIKAHK